MTSFYAHLGDVERRSTETLRIKKILVISGKYFPTFYDRPFYDTNVNPKLFERKF